MPAAGALLDALRARGIVIEAAGGRLRYRPRDAVTPDLRVQLAAHKRTLLAILSDTVEPGRLRSPYAHPWPDGLKRPGMHWVGPFDICASCGDGTWGRYGLTVLCLACALAREESG